MIRDVCSELCDVGAAAIEAEAGMMMASASPELLGPFERLLDLADSPVMATLLRREIIYRLLIGPAGGQLRNIAMQGSHANRIATAIAWLRPNYTAPACIEDLARIAAMAVSTFHLHFKAVTHMSPLQYQKKVRLHEARRLLLNEATDAAEAAYRVGYESATQFNREYRRQFGDPPIRDIRRTRRG